MAVLADDLIPGVSGYLFGFFIEYRDNAAFCVGDDAQLEGVGPELLLEGQAEGVDLVALGRPRPALLRDDQGDRLGGHQLILAEGARLAARDELLPPGREALGLAAAQELERPRARRDGEARLPPELEPGFEVVVSAYAGHDAGGGCPATQSLAIDENDQEMGEKKMLEGLVELHGLPPDESDELLDHLYRQADVPEYQCRFQWAKNSIAFWDNRSVQHYASSDYWPQVRKVERVTIIDPDLALDVVRQRGVSAGAGLGGADGRGGQARMPRAS